MMVSSLSTVHSALTIAQGEPIIISTETYDILILFRKDNLVSHIKRTHKKSPEEIKELGDFRNTEIEI